MKIPQNSLAVPQKVKHRVTIWPSDSVPRYVRKLTENTFNSGPKQTLDTSVQSSTIHNSQKVETTRMSINWWLDEQIVEYPCNGILFSHKQEWSTDTLVQQGWTLRMIRWVREARHRRSYVIWFQLYEISRTGKSIETESSLVAARGWGKRGNGEWVPNGCGVSIWSDEMFWN